MSRPIASLGFTLVEILISLVIGLFLTAGMIQMYVANKQTYRFNEAIARMQENGRYALERMGSDLRVTGFMGCSRGERITSHVDPTDADYSGVWHDFANGLEGRDSPSGIAGDPDEVTIKGAVGTGFVVQGRVSATNPITVLGSATAVEKAICGYNDCLDNRIADMVLVSNCKHGDIFQVTSLTSAAGKSAVGFSADEPDGTPGNKAGTALSVVYDGTAALHPLRVATFCVSDSPNCHDPAQSPGAPGQRSLYLRENGVDRGPVVEGVENMQIAYGEDLPDVNGSLDGTANRYVPGSVAGIVWENVVSVRVSLLLSSPEVGMTSDVEQTFDLNGDPDDGEEASCPNDRICQVMSSTFTLRNRAL